MGVGGTYIAGDAPDLPRVTWYKHKGLIKLYLLLVIALSSSATTGYDGSMMNALQSVDYWKNYFGNPEGAPLGLLNAIYPVGSMVAMPIFPVIADRLGRRWGIIVGAIVILIAVALQASAQNLGMFTAARFLIGLGVQIAQGCAPLLITEVCHPQHRARFTAIYNTTWFVGNIIATWVTFATAQDIQNTWCWRLPSLLQGIFAAFQLVGIWFVPESPRWYVQQNRPERALKILAHYFAFDDENDVTVQFVFREIETTLALEKEFARYSILEFFKTKGNRHRLLILVTLGFFSQLSGNAIISYYLTKVLDQVGITNQKEQLEINGALGIWGWVIAVISSLVIEKFGRRKMFLISTFSMMLVYIGITVCAAQYAQTQIQAAGNALIAMLVLYGAAYSLAWSGLLVAYAAEIVPYALRSKGIAIMFFCVNAALFFNNYVNPVALNNIGWKYYIVYDVWLLVELIVVWFFYPETKGPTLEEMARIFDGDEAAVGAIDLDIVREKHGIALEEKENAGTKIQTV